MSFSKWSVLLPAAFIAAAPLSTTLGADEKTTYQDHVLPLFRNNCLNCHNPDKKKAGLDLSSYGAMLAGSDNGPVINPGDAAGSRLYKSVTHAEDPTMPPKKPKLPDKELEVIRAWIAGGALETANGKAAVAVRPKVDLVLTKVVVGKPKGPVPMPRGIPTEPITHIGRQGAMVTLASDPWAPLIAVGGQRQVLLYHSQTLELLGVLPFPEGLPHVITFSRNGSLLLAGGGIAAKSGKVVLYDVATGKRLTSIGDEFDSVLAADISPDQSIVALGGPGKVVKGYSAGDGSLLFTIKKHTDWITAVAFSPDGNLLATADRAGNLAVWEARTGRDLFTTTGHKEAITALSFRDDSKILASCGTDGLLKLWNMEDGKEIKSWAAHGNYRPPTGAVGVGTFDPTVGALSVEFTHDGRLVTAGRDKTVKVWEPSGKLVRAMGPMSDDALCAVMDDEGHRVIGGDLTGKINLWNLDDGKVVGELSADPLPIAQRLEAAMKRLAEAQPAVEKTKADVLAAQDAAGKAQTDLQAAQAAAEDARKKLAELQAKAKTAPDAAAALNKARLHADAAAKQAAECAAAVDKAEQEAREWVAHKAALEHAVAEKQESLDEARKILSDAKDAVEKKTEDDALQHALKAAQARVDQSGDQLATAKKALDDAASARHVDDEAITRAKLQADQAEASVNTARQTLTAAEKVADDAKAASAAVEAAKSSADALTKAVVPRTEAAKAAKDKIAALQKGADEATGNMQAAKVAVAKLKADEANAALSAARNNLTDLETKLEAMKQQIKTAQAAAEKAASDAASFEKNLPTAPHRLAAAQQAGEKAKLAAASAKAAAAEAAEDLKQREALAQGAADLSRELSALAAKRNDEKALIEAAGRAKGALDSLTADVAAVKESIMQKADTAKKAIEAQTTADAVIAELRQETTNGGAMLARIKKAAADAALDVKKSQAALDQASAPIEQAKAKIKDLQAKYEKLDHEVQQVAEATAPK